MRRTDRLFELIQLFREGRLWRGQDLADRLEVSVRTVYRDIDTLVASGVPIEGERGVGYILRAPIFLPPLTLTAEELEALYMGVDLVQRSGDPALAGAAGALKGKVDAVVGDARRTEAGTPVLTPMTPVPRNAMVHLPVLRRAVRNRELVALEYLSLGGAATSRIIRPLHLHYWGTSWTLAAWCEMRSDFRVFRPDRIERIETGIGSFTDEQGKTIEDFLARPDPLKDSDPLLQRRP
jgi:predicted DNA-binding transcriptional regulator YafY